MRQRDVDAIRALLAAIFLLLLSEFLAAGHDSSPILVTITEVVSILLFVVATIYFWIGLWK